MNTAIRLALYVCVFGAGVGAGAVLFRSPSTVLRSTCGPNGVETYSYYVNDRGAEIRHGWAYRYRYNGGLNSELIERFDDGRLVYSLNKSNPRKGAMADGARLTKSRTGFE